MTKNSTKTKGAITQSINQKPFKDGAVYNLNEASFSFKKAENNSINITQTDPQPIDPKAKIIQELCSSLGTSSQSVFNEIMSCVMRIYGDDYTDDNLNFVVKFIKELKPKDVLETMLIIQMLAVHNMTMRSFYRAGLKDQTTYGVEQNISRATKFSRTYVSQMDALKKYRSKGDQKITVEHINVNDGGKAFIGTANTQINNGLEDLINGGVGTNEK